MNNIYYIWATFVTIISSMTTVIMYNNYGLSSQVVYVVIITLLLNILMWLLANSVTVYSRIKAGNAIIVGNDTDSDVYETVSIDYQKDCTTIITSEGNLTIGNVLIDYMYNDIHGIKNEEEYE